MIFTMMVSGTDWSMPTGPHTHPQNSNDMNTTSTESPKRLPIRVGSSRLPRTVSMTRYPSATPAADPGPNWTSAMSTGGMAATIEPMLGM